MTRIPWERFDGVEVETIIAMLLNAERPSSTRISSSSGDGGVDILDAGAAVDDGDIVYQVKRHTGPLNRIQMQRVEESLYRVLSDRRWEHRNFTQWNLVMPWDPTPEKERWLYRLGEKHGLQVRWHGLTFVDRLAAEHPRIVDVRLGERIGASGKEWGTLSGEIDELSKRSIESILGRLGGDGLPLLSFPSTETEGFLDRAGAAQRSGQVAIVGLKAHVENVEGRAQVADVQGLYEISAQFEHLVEPLAPFVSTDSHLIDQISPNLTIFKSRLNEAMSELWTYVKTQRSRADAAGDTDLEFEERSRLDRLMAYSKGLSALSAFITPAITEVEAAIKGCLLVTGPWGTGKSYQIARYTQREIDAGRPILLLRARDFVDPAASIISQQWWRAQLGAQSVSDERFIEALDAVGRWAGAPLTIAIDGLNESSLRDPSTALKRLIDLTNRYQFVRVLITDRQDHNGQSLEDIPAFRHVAPDRAGLSRVLEAALGIPPGTPWHAALTNPLLASIAARVIEGQKQMENATAAGSLSRVALLNAWIALLVSETSSHLSLTASTVQALIDSIATRGGTYAVRDAAKSSGVSRETSDVILNRLVDEGLFERHASEPDTVRFRWQGAADVLAARILLEEHPKNGAIGLLQNVPDANRLTALDTIAETLPTLTESVEILDLRLPGVSDEDRDVAFARSLGGRPDVHITTTTEKYAQRVLKGGNEPAHEIVWSVFSSPRRKRLGLQWLNDQLLNTRLSTRTQFWPSALVHLCDASPSDRSALEALLTWYADTLIPESSAHEATKLVETLAWFACTPELSQLPAFAVSGIVELVHIHPKALAHVWERLKDVDDDHPRDGILTAAVGIVSRWPTSNAAEAARELCTRITNAHRAKSLRSVAAIHEVVGSKQPLHEYLRDLLPPLPRMAAGLPRLQMPEDDRAMFADGRTSAQANRFESRVWKSFVVPFRHTLGAMVAREGHRGRPDDRHYSALFRGRWLAYQYAYHPAGSRRWSPSHGAVKAGTPLNPDAEYAAHPGQLWDSWVDPTIPLELIIGISDHVDESTWWAIDGTDPTITVTDPCGVRWVVLHGGFRTLDPDNLADSDRRSVRIGSGGWWFDTDSGAPASGLLRHDYIAVSHAQLTDADDNGIGPVENTQCRFGDLFKTDDSTPGALTHTVVDGTIDLHPPTATLLGLLDATWTGEGIDCRNDSGTLVITDPGSSIGRPRAVLAHRDSLEAALSRHGKKITINVRVVDNHSRRSYSDSPTSVVTLGRS